MRPLDNWSEISRPPLTSIPIRSLVSASADAGIAAAAAAATADLFGIAKSKRLLEMKLLRFKTVDGEVPVASSTVWLAPKHGKIAEVIENDGRTVVELMRVHFGHRVARIRQRISARSLDEQTARHLMRPAAEASLVIERHYFEQDQPFVFLRTLSICRGDLTQVEADFLASSYTGQPP